jgi:hypothetical protein
VRRLTAIVAAFALSAIGTGCGTSAAVEAQCSRPSSAIFVLAAQSVPDATLIPCVKTLPSGWSPGGSEIVDGRMTFWLNSDRAGVRALEVDLLPSCDVSDAVEVAPAPGEVGTRRYEQPISLQPSYSGNRYYVFSGGCITYRYRFQTGASTTLALEADEALSFTPRSVVVAAVQDDLGLSLCGVGAPPCAG